MTGIIKNTNPEKEALNVLVTNPNDPLNLQQLSEKTNLKGRFISQSLTKKLLIGAAVLTGCALIAFTAYKVWESNPQWELNSNWNLNPSDGIGYLKDKLFAIYQPSENDPHLNSNVCHLEDLPSGFNSQMQCHESDAVLVPSSLHHQVIDSVETTFQPSVNSTLSSMKDIWGNYFSLNPSNPPEINYVDTLIDSDSGNSTFQTNLMSNLQSSARYQWENHFTSILENPPEINYLESLNENEMCGAPQVFFEEQASYGSFKGITKDQMEQLFGTGRNLKESEARNLYNHIASFIKEYGVKAINKMNSTFSSSIAEAACETRHAARLYIRERGSKDAQTITEFRDLCNTGSFSGLSCSELTQKYAGNYTRLIEKAGEPNPGISKLIAKLPPFVLRKFNAIGAAFVRVGLAETRHLIH